MGEITAGSSSNPAQTVLVGAPPGAKLQEIIDGIGDDLGFKPSNQRFRAAVIRWVNRTLEEIQLEDPLMRRTCVLDAAFTIDSNQDTYDVRTDFGWNNCFSILSVKFPDLQQRPLEFVTLEQYRNRGILAGDSGEPSYAVLVDQVRVRFVPPPSQEFSGVGDYLQDIPKIASPDDRVDWPRPWDVALYEGVLYRGLRWNNQENVAVWGGQRRVFERMVQNIRNGEAVQTRAPGKAVVVRARKRPVIPHDNSADIRWRR